MCSSPDKPARVVKGSLVGGADWEQTVDRTGGEWREGGVVVRLVNMVTSTAYRLNCPEQISRAILKRGEVLFLLY